jgi:Fe-Mn family superoxide dismutase
MKTDGRATYSAKSFDHLKGLTGISDGQIAEHLDLYAGYVKQVNSLAQELSEMRVDRKEAGKDFGLAEGTRRFAYEYDGMVPARAVLLQLEARRRLPAQRSPGARARARRDIRVGRALAGPLSGDRRHARDRLGDLFEDPASHRLINQWVSLHQDGIPARWNPLLVLDVWEHAFMRDYKASERAKYIEAFFKNVDWSVVEQRLREPAAVKSAA